MALMRLLTAVFLGDVSRNVTIFQVTLQRAALDHRHMRPHGWQRDQGPVFPRQKRKTLGAQPDEVRWVWGYPNAYHGTACWLNQPIWKLCSSNWIISPIFGVKKKWNHHLYSMVYAPKSLTAPPLKIGAWRSGFLFGFGNFSWANS